MTTLQILNAALENITIEAFNVNCSENTLSEQQELDITDELNEHLQTIHLTEEYPFNLADSLQNLIISTARTTLEQDLAEKDYWPTITYELKIKEKTSC